MTEELTKKAAEMLLQGATLLSEPCPYCKGVRVIKEGKALCINCGRQPEKKEIPIENQPNETFTVEEVLRRKLEALSSELEQEKDHQKQQDILKTINSLLETRKKMKKIR